MNAAASSLPNPTAGEFITIPRYIPCGAPRRYDFRWLLQQITKAILWAYLRVFHDFKFRYHPGMPHGRPYVVVINHTSVLDVPALIVANPYDPPTSMVIRSDMLRKPILGWILRIWGAIGVERSGRDVAALRKMKKLFAEGRGICIAPSGTRSTDGRLGPVNPVLVRLILESDVAVFPTVIVGSLECMPKGSKLPRPGRIYLDTGPEIDLRRFRGRRLPDDELVEVARVIRDAIADLLPDSMKPNPDGPVLRRHVVET